MIMIEEENFVPNGLTAKPVRMDAHLFSPEMLNLITSKKQFEFLFKVASRTYFGNLHIAPSEWADELNTSYDTAAKIRNLFVKYDIINHIDGYEYQFNYYKDMVNEKSNYVKLYKFFFTPYFKELPLPAMRLCLYLVGELSKISKKSKNVLVVNINKLYHRNAFKKRLFPIANKTELIGYLRTIQTFFDMDMSMIDKGSFVVSGIKKHLDEAIYVTDMYKWVRNFLEEQVNIVYVNDFHLNQFVKTYDNYARTFGYEETKGAFKRAFQQVNQPEHTDTANYIRSLFYHEPEVEEMNQEYSGAVRLLISEFLEEEFATVAKDVSTQLQKHVEPRVSFTTMLKHYTKDVATELYNTLYVSSSIVRKEAEDKLSAIQDYYVRILEQATKRIDNAATDEEKTKLKYNLKHRLEKLYNRFRGHNLSKLIDKYYELHDTYLGGNYNFPVRVVPEAEELPF